MLDGVFVYTATAGFFGALAGWYFGHAVFASRWLGVLIGVAGVEVATSVARAISLQQWTSPSTLGAAIVGSLVGVAVAVLLSRA